MGLFKHTTTCVICGKEIDENDGIQLKWNKTYDSKGNLETEFVCKQCIEDAYLRSYPVAKSTSLELRRLVAKRAGMVNVYSPTIKFAGERLQIDEAHVLFSIDGNLFRYDQLGKFELLEDRCTATDQNFLNYYRYCSYLEIFIYIHDSYVNHAVLPFLSEPTIVGISNFFTNYDSRLNANYINALHNAKCCQAALEQIAETAKMHKLDSAMATQPSAADEIRKFKELADDGIITQEEFEAKKRQLLA